MKVKQFHEPSLYEFVYTVAMTSPLSLKRKLPEKYFNAVRTEKSIKRFISQSSFDQKKEFLSYLGYKSCLIISMAEDVWRLEMKEAFKKFQSKNPAKSFKEIFENDFYVTSDKNLLSFLDTMARVTDSEVYSMEMEMIRVQKGVENWSPKLDNPELIKYKKDEKDWDSFIKLALLACADLMASETYFNVSQSQMMLLLFMFINRRVYVSHQELVSKFSGTVNKKNISLAEKRLLEEVMIQKSFDRTKREYSITSRGILKVFEYRNRLQKSYMFNTQSTGVAI